MERIINRRCLVTGAAALPIAAAMPGTIQAEPVPAPPAKPDISEIPGLDLVEMVTMFATVRTIDGRLATLQMQFSGFGGVDLLLMAPGHTGTVNHIGGDGLDSLPTWLQRELGYACMAAGRRKA